MDLVKTRFEQYIKDAIDNRIVDNIPAEDLLVYAMIVQEYIKHCNAGLNYEEVLHKYNETMFKILGRGEKNGC